MPEYLSPGVYVEEVDTGNKPIEGVATSTVGFVGVAERGPTQPTLVTSFSEFTRLFGRYVNTPEPRYLARGVEGFFQNGGKRCFVTRIVSRGNPIAAPPVPGATSGRIANSNNAFRLEAIGPGTWANGRLVFKVGKGSLDDPAQAGVQRFFRLTLMYFAGPAPAPTANMPDPTDSKNATNPARREPTIVEMFDNLTTDPTSNSFHERHVNGASVLVTIAAVNNIPPALQPQPTNPPTPLTIAANQIFPATGIQGSGTDGPALTLADFIGAPSTPPTGPPPAVKTPGYGLAALEEVDEVAILTSPDEHAVAGVTGELIGQCERLKDRFAILQAAPGVPDLTNFRPSSNSKYGAFYFPWIRITDPLTSLPMEIPPAGHIAGIYARSDIERGVHKAPANEVIRGLYLDPADPSSGLQVQISKAQQDILNPRGINVLRFFPGRGNLVWGARTTSPDPDWRYVNVRRLFIFVEESIEEATQWVVFEPNDDPLWARVRRSVGDFLTRLWMDGMLQGRTKDEAYFVRCDRTTMTQADIDLGRLIMLIGIAPVKPAEFVIFRIGQWTGGSDVAEG